MIGMGRKQHNLGENLIQFICLYLFPHDMYGGGNILIFFLHLQLQVGSPRKFNKNFCWRIDLTKKIKLYWIIFYSRSLFIML